VILVREQWEADILIEAEKRGIVAPTIATLEKYGLTEIEWLQFLMAQGWKCPICLREQTKWNTDHDHVPKWKTMLPIERKKYVRGILCWYCNHRRVNSRMSAEEAQRIADYLAAYEARRDA
jgi:hypothetical protein